MSRFPGFTGEEYVAEGGLGRVWRAERASTGGVVAIKEIKQVDVGSPAWHRARREVEALVRLKGHPNVVSVEEIVAGPEGPALVMEYLDSGSLAQRISQGALPLNEAMRVGQSILSAIGAAHDVGIIHRDLKPQNVLLGKYGQVKVCDFGIAAIARDGERTMTSASTLAYASPEELDGSASVGPPGDVYSFCVTMVHAISGVRPSFAERLSGRVALPPELATELPMVASSLLIGLATDPSTRPTISDLDIAFGVERHVGSTQAPGLQSHTPTIVRTSAPGGPRMPPAKQEGEDDTPADQLGASVTRVRMNPAPTVDQDVESVESIPAANSYREILYDFSEWKSDEVAWFVAELSERGVAHSWEGDDLVIDRENEQVVDAIIDRLTASIPDDVSLNPSLGPSVVPLEPTIHRPAT